MALQNIVESVSLRLCIVRYMHMVILGMSVSVTMPTTPTAHTEIQRPLLTANVFVTGEKSF